jgi:hypothetical protein
VDLERGPLSLVSTIDLLGRKSIGSGLEIREFGRRDPSRWPRGTLYPRKLALILPTSCGCSVGIVHFWTQATEFGLWVNGVSTVFTHSFYSHLQFCAHTCSSHILLLCSHIFLLCFIINLVKDGGSHEVAKLWIRENWMAWEKLEWANELLKCHGMLLCHQFVNMFKRKWAVNKHWKYSPLTQRIMWLWKIRSYKLNILIIAAVPCNLLSKINILNQNFVSRS